MEIVTNIRIDTILQCGILTTSYVDFEEIKYRNIESKLLKNFLKHDIKIYKLYN